jgi:hypothetical protein
MSQRTYSIKLSKEERQYLERYVREGKKSARAINRARILLLADEQNSDEQIIAVLGVSRTTAYRIRKGYGEVGVHKALQEKSRSGAPSRIDGRVEATLTMLACSDPPDGHSRWTLQLLADKVVELGVIESISVESVRTTLKKTS